MDNHTIDSHAAEVLAARLATIGDVLKERRHQIACGHTPDKDAAHPLGVLSRAAMATVGRADDAGAQGALFAAYFWPFDWRQIPKTADGRRRLLVKAMALLLAELERLPRTALPAAPPVLLLTDRQ